MIQIENIKDIPKYMIKKIRKLDKQYYPEQNGVVRFYRYYTTMKNELCEIVVAVKNRYKKWYCKQVVIHGIHSKYCLLRDIGFTMGFYHVGWLREGFTRKDTWFDYDWDFQQDKYFYIRCPIVNKEYISSLSKYKYSAAEHYCYHDLMKYLRYYEQYPQAEYLVKNGLSLFATSKMLLEKCTKDKQFCKWLSRNKDDIKDTYYVSSIIRAYKSNKPIKEMYKFDLFKKAFEQEGRFERLKQVFSKEKTKFLTYLLQQNIDGYSYSDYLTACEYLGLDMSLDKNRYPHDFKFWHDTRIDEYHTAKALQDEKDRKELYNKFNKIAEKYLPMQRNLKEDYMVVIAHSPEELIQEGKVLHHCVGRMGYDQKFAREESLIFFVRNKEDSNQPFVTLEYSLKNHKVLQCYAKHNSQPNEAVLNFVNKIWLPYANRKLRKIA